MTPRRDPVTRHMGFWRAGSVPANRQATIACHSDSSAKALAKIMSPPIH
jgi:hypothetical protein